MIPISDGDFFNWIQSISRNQKKTFKQIQQGGPFCKSPIARLSTHVCSSVSMIAPDNNPCVLHPWSYFFQSWRVRHINIYVSFVILNSSIICSLFIFFQVGFLHLYLTLLMLLFSYLTTNYHSTYCPGMPQCPWQCQDYHHNILILRNHHSYIIVLIQTIHAYPRHSMRLVYLPHMKMCFHFYGVKSPANFEWVQSSHRSGPFKARWKRQRCERGAIFSDAKAFERFKVVE